ncbi:hypothetical protein AJ79_02404 [Helicocarpus griseus UAMH5409]|uniref:Putative gamma-glutamylcyclotransferase n=1 Tax=Helicocarpus griseus UAMH5409 TaxID=1447875 RepID=A0A2B7Y3M5_9EURO|nr:hypothetical protein AJ79_02404 [Helicocarpus griseus UAMH5409]
MEFFNGPEKMARNSTADDGISEADINRWQMLFYYSRRQAVEAIKQHRNDLTREPIPESLWELVQSERESVGFNREAYEHHVQKQKQYFRRSPSEDRFPISSSLRYFIPLEDNTINSPTQIQTMAGLSEPPKVIEAIGEHEEPIAFCELNSTEFKALVSALELCCDPRYQPTFLTIPTSAPKQLSSTSIYPTLGIDSTLPQHRPETLDPDLFQPAQDTYPVWYFFYGTLKDPEHVRELCGLPKTTPMQMHPARITGGALKLWGGKYKALVDGPSTAAVTGVAYEVQRKEAEDYLRAYETSNYEVVRCEISLTRSRQTVKGCTFRFIDDKELSP